MKGKKKRRWDWVAAPSSTVDRKLLVWIMNKFKVLLRKENAVINN